MRDTKETQERDELAKREGITPAAAQAQLPDRPAPKNPNHKDAT